MIDRALMEKQLVLHEGLRLQAYVDTKDNWTIGVGYNITGRGYEAFESVVGHAVRPPDGMNEKAHCTESEALAVLAVDVDRYERAVVQYFPESTKLDGIRQRVVLDMAFNMGFKALGFVRCIAAIKLRNWSVAAKELYKSEAYTEEPNRIDRLAKMLLTGQDYTS